MGPYDLTMKRLTSEFAKDYVRFALGVDPWVVQPRKIEDFTDLWGVDDLDCLSRYDGLLYIRINGLGAWCLGLAEEYVPAPTEASHVLKVFPKLDIVITESLPRLQCAW